VNGDLIYDPVNWSTQNTQLFWAGAKVWIIESYNKLKLKIKAKDAKEKRANLALFVFVSLLYHI
jgi:hypothetical protein